MCAPERFLRESLEIYDFVAEDMSLVMEDRVVWSCLIFCSVEAREYQRDNAFFSRLKTLGAPSHKDYGNLIRYTSVQGYCVCPRL